MPSLQARKSSSDRLDVVDTDSKRDVVPPAKSTNVGEHSLSSQQAMENGATMNGHQKDFEKEELISEESHHVNEDATNHSHNPQTNGSSLSDNASTQSTKSSNAPNRVGYTQSPIAICGMALRLPAGLKTPRQLWDFLLAGGDSRGRVPASRYNADAFYDQSGKPSTAITEYGHFLDEEIGCFDPSLFNMSRTEAERADPQQRLLLEVTRECLEDAGETRWKGKKIGCYVGSLGEDWLELFARETQNWGTYRYTGYSDFMLSNRISYEMDFQGPSMTVRTACSSSLVALHEACMAIERGDCESAVVGGTNLILQPATTATMSELGVLSPDGSCKTFSADANGYARGEAITAVFVKRLDHALRNGNAIRAVIRGTAANHGGRTASLTTPSTNAQEALMQRAYQVAGIVDCSKTGYVECHGTGTLLGDPIETKAVAKVFGQSGVHIGSIKPNFGHTEGASGVLSIIKAVLALENRTIPPNIKFTSPNPAIPFVQSKLTVPTKPMSWPPDRDERISVNSFGIGGANAHAIIDSAASLGLEALRNREVQQTHLLLLSANSQNALGNVVENIRKFVEMNPSTVEDLAYTLANKREHLPHRTFAMVSDGSISAAPPATKSMHHPSIIMLFTGQGAQWPQMGCSLMDSNPIFLSTIRLLDQYLQRLGKSSPEWSIEIELRQLGTKSRVHKAQFSQPLCTAIQIALVDVLASLGVQPYAVVGHSSGEIAAAYAAGALTAEEAIVSSFHRGAVTSFQEKAGAMAAVGLDCEETKEYLMQGVSIACDNSPKSVTISGDKEKVEVVLTSIRKSRPDALAQKLRVDKAYHSHHMVAIGDQYLSLIESVIKPKEPKLAFFSTVAGQRVKQSMVLDAKYWQRNLENPVLFKDAILDTIRHLIGEKPVYLEIGPHSALAGPLRQILTQESVTAPYISTLTRNQDSRETLFTAVGKLWALQVPVRMNVLLPRGKCLSNLPPYPWDHEEIYWHESRLSIEHRQRKYPHHDLLGTRTIDSSDFEPSWRNVLHLSSAAWIRDHKVDENIVFPFAGYVAMAGEAIRQISGIEPVFQLRDVLVKTALVIPEEMPTELITTLRPHRLTDTSNSEWWDFTITSHNRHSWIKHCIGQVTARQEFPMALQQPEAFPRMIDWKAWFNTLRNGGLDLGAAFCNLGKITVDTVNLKASGEVINGRHNEADKYHVHPTVIDSVLQLIGVACTNGQPRKFKNQLPVSCRSLSISRNNLAFEVGVQARSLARSVVADIRGVVNDTSVLSISGMKLAAVDQTDSSKLGNTHTAARLEWGPDIAFQDIKDLVKPSIDRVPYVQKLNELGNLCIMTSQRQCTDLPASEPWMEQYRQWINSQCEMSDMKHLDGLDNTALASRVSEIIQSLKGSPAEAAANALNKVALKINDIFSGTAPSWEAILTGHQLHDLYVYLNECDMSPLIRTLAHCKPNLRVLELGSWISTPSSSNIENLKLPDGRNQFSKYTFTSKGFISGAEKKADSVDVEYVTLDIGKDPFEQGFEGRQYDLIIASNVLHTTRSLHKSLVHIKKLLHPEGYLFLQELCPHSSWVNYILGAHPRWWQSTEDDRSAGPCVNVSGWRDVLETSGFQRDTPVLLDSVKASQVNGILLARPAVDSNKSKRVSLLLDEQSEDGDAVLLELQSMGYEVEIHAIQNRIVPGQDIIALLDIEQPFFDNITASRFESFKTLLQNLKETGLFWVTRPAQMHTKDPRFAQTIGVARTMRSELLVDFATCEVADVKSSAALIAQTFTKFANRIPNDSLQPDFEYAIDNDVVNVGRFYPFPLSQDLATSQVDDRIVLDVDLPGRLSSLQWIRKPAFLSLGSDEVEIEMHTVGLNFKDVLIAMNIVQPPDGHNLGLEGAGIVRRTGSEAQSLQPGDRVVIVEANLFATTVQTREANCRKIPDDLNLDEAATMFVPYMTAIHSLVTVGGLQKGQTVLIHSACGGVGLAAIQVARVQQAEIYVTVGSEQKVQHLMKHFNIPNNRIFNSRDDSFKADVMRETAGRGVDLVLNSLSGELLHASWECVAPFGKMVEIGKRDLMGNGMLNMNPFLANRSYCCVDLQAFQAAAPQVLLQIFDTALEWYCTGLISPLRPVEAFSAKVPYDAFRYMQPGSHMGRICMSLRDESGNLLIDRSLSSRQRALRLKSSAAYLLVGGLGGLGRSVALWMVELGARHLIFLSRNAGLTSSDQQFLAELQSMGCDAQLVRGSVTNLEDVEKTVRAAKQPLKGVLQMSMVLRDENFLKMDLEKWSAAILPKVLGSWNLHNATQSTSIDLDFFVLFSSLSGIIGQPGQANYASANTFLDAFVQYRRSLKLPASAIDIGAIAEVGYLSSNRDLLQKMKATGFVPLKEQEVLDALTVAIAGGRSNQSDESGIKDRFMDRNNFVIGLSSPTSLSDPANRAIWRKDRRMAVYHNIIDGTGESTASSESLKSYIESAKANTAVLKDKEAATFFAQEIGRKLFALLLKPEDEINLSMSLADQGMDSLVGIELRSWWKQVFGFDLSIVEMLSKGTLEALGEHAARGLLDLR